MQGAQESNGRSPLRLAVAVALIAVIAAVAAVVALQRDGEDEPTPTAQIEATFEADLPGSAAPATPSGTPIGPATAAPNATPAPSPCGETGRPAATEEIAVVNAEVRLREGPGTTCRTIQFIPEGTEVRILSEMQIDDAGNIWSRVRLVESGTEGWMGFTFLDIQS